MKKDLLIVLVVASLAVTAFLVSSESAAPTTPQGGDPYVAGAGKPVSIGYRSEGGLSPVTLFEATVRGPGDSSVRYQLRGRPLVTRSHPVSEVEFKELLARFARADFFEVESVPRSGYYADMASQTIALTVGDDRNEVTIDARRRASRDLGPIISYFEGIRKAVTPEAIVTGD